MTSAQGKSTLNSTAGGRPVRRYLRQSILFLMRLTGLIRLFRFLHRRQIVILMIHGVMDEEDRPSWTPLWRRVSRNRLDEYLRVLSRRYRFVSLMDAVEMLQGRKPVQPYSMVLTFDDGYRNNVTHALPILRRYHAPATFFVPTGFVDHPRPLWYDRLDYAIQNTQADERELKISAFSMRLDYSSREALHKSFIQFVRTAQKERMSDTDFLKEMDHLTYPLEAESGRSLSDILTDDDWSAVMTWEQVEKEAGNGVSFGSHTVDHIRLGLVEPGIALDQLARSKRAIELHTGKLCRSISFPNGSYTDETIRLARECGYLCGLTTEEGLNRAGDDVMRLRRIGLPASVSATELLAGVSGASTPWSSLVRICFNANV
jgi:peptidoglycan/xylan/chitin deacetylase (PgdA/CDA1 family)